MKGFFDFLELPWVQNSITVFGFAALAFFLWRGSKNESWKRAGQRLRKDRVGIVSLCVIGLYLFIGALEMIQLPSKAGKRTILDALTQKVAVEKSYSAPFAKTTLSHANPGAAEWAAPARHRCAGQRHLRAGAERPAAPR